MIPHAHNSIALEVLAYKVWHHHGNIHSGLGCYNQMSDKALGQLPYEVPNPHQRMRFCRR